MPPGAGNDEDELDDEALHSDEAADLPGTLFRAPTLLCQADGMVSWFVVIPLLERHKQFFLADGILAFRSRFLRILRTPSMARMPGQALQLQY